MQKDGYTLVRSHAMIKWLGMLLLFWFPVMVGAEASTCYGTSSNGYLKSGVQLPENGNNFEGYSLIARLSGRTYVHSAVMSILVESYKNLETTLPDKVFKYAETGFREGGEFKPHKTHRNGLSVDFMTPVLNAENQSVHLPSHLLNKFGYDIEFDKHGNYGGLRIDYVALAGHIVALHKEAQKQGFGIWRVIFDPKLQPHLFDTFYGTYLKRNISFSRKRSWVRHDEHYHVDFSVPCKDL